MVQMCAGVEDATSPLLSQPKCDCLLITNIDLASQQWLELLPWRMRESAHSGIASIEEEECPTLYSRGGIIVLCT